MNTELGIKELYEVVLKTTFPMKVNGISLEEGEVVAAFDKIFIANFQEFKQRAVARGGYDNAGLVFWEETKEMQVNFSQGVFSKQQLSLMNNSFLETKNSEPIIITQRECLESDENGQIKLKHPFIKLFCYIQNTGEKISNWIKINEQTIQIAEPYQDVLVDYTFSYVDERTILTIGRPLTEGFLELQGKTRVKDDTTGQIKTGILEIPRLKLMSNLSMQLGENAIPLVGKFSGLALPVGNRGQKKVMQIHFLNDDIDSDI